MPGCVMSLPTNSGGKKYTVEQAELIRRLRNSGMTKEQVLMAFESFDLIDQCLGNIVNISSLTQKPGINSSSVAVLAENLMSRQTIIPAISSSCTNLTTNLQTSLLSSIKIPHMTSPILSPIIPVTLTPQPSSSVSQTSITALAASAVTPVTSVVAVAGNALQLQLSATSQQSSGASQQLQQQTQVMQVLQQLGILGAAASNSITPVAATMSISKGLTAPSLTSSLPLNLSQAVSQSLLSSQLHQQPQQSATQLLSSPLPQQSQLALQLQQLPHQLQAQLHQTHSAHNSAVQASPSTALVNLSPVLQQLIQQQSQQSQNSVVQQLQQIVALQQLQQAKHLFDSQSPQALITSLIAAAASQQQPTTSTATAALLPSQLIQLQQLAQLPLQQQILQQQQQLQHHQQTIASLASSTPSTMSSVKMVSQTSTLQQEQLLQQIIKQLHNNTAAADKQQLAQQPQTPVTSSSLSNPGSQLNSLVEEALSSADDKQGRAGTSGRRSINFKNGIMKEDADEDGTFLKQEEILCCEEIKEFTVINNVKQHQIAALTGISQAYISRYLKGEYMGMSDKCCRTIKKWYLTYKNNPAAIEENANRQAQLAASRLADLNDNGGTSMEMDHSESYTLPPPVTTTPSTASSSGLTYPRRERFVFRPNHLELLEKCFMEENYPSLKRREEIAKACNIATEKLTGRALSDKEKVGVQTISNWFANKRKDLKRLFKEDGMEAASPFLTRTRGRPPLTQSDPHFFSTIPGLSLFNHHPALKIGQRLEQQTLNGIDIGNGNEVMIGQSKENLLLGEAEAAALQLSVETAAVNQAIYSLTGQLPIIPLPPNKKGTPELSQQTAEFLSNLVANFKNSINGESSKVKSIPSQSNGACEQEPVNDDFSSEQQETIVPPAEANVPEHCSEVIYSCGESNLEGAMMFSNGQQDGDSIFDDIMSGEVAMNCELGSSD